MLSTKYETPVPVIALVWPVHRARSGQDRVLVQHVYRTETGRVAFSPEEEIPLQPGTSQPQVVDGIVNYITSLTMRTAAGVG